MTDEQALLAAVIAAPDDDLPRLVYADWLDDHATADGVCPRCDGRSEIRFCDAAGDMDDEPCKACGGSLAGGYKRGTGRVGNGFAERAEFVRVQCELAKPEPKCEAPGYTGKGILACAEWNTRHPDHDNWCRPCSERRSLRRRERELLSSRGPDWLGLPGRGWTTVVWSRGFVASVCLTLAAFAGGPCGRCRESGHLHRCRTCHCLWAEYPPDGTFPQGSWSLADEYQTAGPCCDNTNAVLDLTKCTLCSGTGRTPGVAPRLFASQPVTRVTLTDREPTDPSDGASVWWWGRPDDARLEHPWSLPWAIFGRLEGREKFGPTGRRTRERHPPGTWNYNVVYPSRSAALEALSAALVAYGRANAEGMSHEVACERCKGEGWYDREPGDGEMSCLDCGGNGKVRRPGLPPLAPTAKETAS